MIIKTNAGETHMATKKELLARAKDLEIEGRWDMTKEELEAAIAECDGGEEDDGEGDEAELPELPEISAAAVVDAKRRYPSERAKDATGRVIRKGVKFNMNVPFREKPYFLARQFAHEKLWTEEYAKAVAAAPPQVRQILETMRSEKITSPSSAEIGGSIVSRGKARGIIISKIDDRMLFAYYRRVLERLGVVYVAEAADDES